MTVLSIGGPGILYFPAAYPGVSLQTGKVRVESPYVAPKSNLRSKKTNYDDTITVDQKYFYQNRVRKNSRPSEFFLSDNLIEQTAIPLENI